MQSVLEILQKCTAYFSEKGIETPKLDAELLLAHALGCKRLDLFLRFEEPLTEDKLAPVRDMVRRRAKREPLQHIIGNVEFFGLNHDMDLPLEEIKRHDKIIICDISLPMDLMFELNETKDLTWIDHHASMIEEYENLSKYEVKE